MFEIRSALISLKLDTHTHTEILTWSSRYYLCVWHFSNCNLDLLVCLCMCVCLLPPAVSTCASGCVSCGGSRRAARWRSSSGTRLGPAGSSSCSPSAAARHGCSAERQQEDGQSSLRQTHKIQNTTYSDTWPFTETCRQHSICKDQSRKCQRHLWLNIFSTSQRVSLQLSSDSLCSDLMFIMTPSLHWKLRWNRWTTAAVLRRGVGVAGLQVGLILKRKLFGGALL